MNKLIVGILVALLITGCAGITGTVSKSTSTFDDENILKMEPVTFFSSEEFSWTGGSICTKIGARWKSLNPNQIILDLKYSSFGCGDSFKNITRMDINIEGNKLSYNTSGSTNHIIDNSFGGGGKTYSWNAVIVPISVVRQMVNSKDTRIRISYIHTYEDALFSIDKTGTGKPGHQYFREFIQQVDEEREKL